MPKYHFYKQHDHSDCGATCLRIIFRYYGKHFTAATMQRMAACGHEGISFFELKTVAEKFGMETCALRLTWEELKEVQKPCIVHWRGNHFVVLTRIRKNLYVISLVLFAQLMLTLGQLGNDLLRGWLTLKCTSLISISFIHRFLTKLTRLPIAFFKTRNAGDIMQRILLARALYRGPYFMFLDEATSALDSETEREIIRRIHYTYVGHTIVMVAHRLSAVRHADHIIVMDQGRVAEQGTHAELMAREGAYHRLMKHQMMPE